MVVFIVLIAFLSGGWLRRWGLAIRIAPYTKRVTFGEGQVLLMWALVLYY